MISKRSQRNMQRQPNTATDIIECLKMYWIWESLGNSSMLCQVWMVPLLSLRARDSWSTRHHFPCHRAAQFIGLIAIVMFFSLFFLGGWLVFESESSSWLIGDLHRFAGSWARSIWFSCDFHVAGFQVIKRIMYFKLLGSLHLQHEQVLLMRSLWVLWCLNRALVYKARVRIS